MLDGWVWVEKLAVRMKRYKRSRRKLEEEEKNADTAYSLYIESLSLIPIDTSTCGIKEIKLYLRGVFLISCCITIQKGFYWVYNVSKLLNSQYLSDHMVLYGLSLLWCHGNIPITLQFDVPVRCDCSA